MGQQWKIRPQYNTTLASSLQLTDNWNLFLSFLQKHVLQSLARTKEPQQEILKSPGNQSIQSLHSMADEIGVLKNDLFSGMQPFSIFVDTF